MKKLIGSIEGIRNMKLIFIQIIDYNNTKLLCNVYEKNTHNIIDTFYLKGKTNEDMKQIFDYCNDGIISNTYFS